MKQHDMYNYLPFKLGSQYDRYEFSLIAVPPYVKLENELAYEPYEYFGSSLWVLDYQVKRAILHFNADILMQVDLLFDGNQVQLFKTSIEAVESFVIPKGIELKIKFNRWQKYTYLTYNKLIYEEKGEQ